uniref:CPG4 domain-containing protein n=1 Tax=Heterorhabditis bacteriophora TaxID=37862 RepID=A0A1I7XMN8_HETBA
MTCFSSYHNASQCIIRRQFEDCFDVTAYDIGMSGLQTLCLGREKELRRYETCLDENFNSVFHQCDQLCMFTKSLSDLSHQKNIRKLAKHGGGYKKFLQEIPYVCSSIGCLSSCIAHQLNEYCPSSGTIIIESLLNPFLRIIHLLNELGVSAKNAVHRQIPPQCYYLINEGKIRNISIGIAPSEEEQQQLKWGLSRINGSTLSLVNDSHILRPHNSEIEVQHEVQNSISLDQTLESSDYSGSSNLVPSTAAVFPSDYNSHDENLIVHELPIDQTLAKSNSFIPVYNTGYDSHDSGESVEIQDSYLDTFPRKVFNGRCIVLSFTDHIISLKTTFHHSPKFETLLFRKFPLFSIFYAFFPSTKTLNLQRSHQPISSTNQENTESIVKSDSFSIDKLLPYQINNFHESKSSHQSDRSLYSVFHVQEIGEKLDQIPPCQKACAKGLQNAIKLIIKSMNHVERYKELCKYAKRWSYNDTYACIAEEKKCGEEESFFETFTSGLKYMCVDQALAFNITIECIDAHASVVQSDGILSSLSGGTRQGSLIDADKVLLGERGSVINSHDDAATQMDYFRQLSSDLCMVSDCFLGCLRTKFNTRCDGSAGTLLSEVLVRPIASSQEKMSLFSPVLGVIVPEPCTFLYRMEKWRTMRNDEREYNTVQDTQKEYEDPEYFYGAIGQEEMRSQCSHTSIPSSAQRMVSMITVERSILRIKLLYLYYLLL